MAASTIGLYLALKIVYDEPTRAIFDFLKTGIATTVKVALAAYAFSLTVGVIMGLARVSKNRLVYNLSSFYVEMVRGIPLLVFLFFIAFGILPATIQALNGWGVPLTMRDVPEIARVIVALGLGYGAYSAEIFRAGIQSIEKGQYEAASALGMNYRQTMRFIVLPQAVRRVLPALGNDFVSMIKDSALVSVLGVRDLTQATKLYAASTFRFLPAWTMAAYLYLAVVIILTRGIRYMETRLQRAYET
jgi:polar amino acid transport system permease protein